LVNTGFYQAMKLQIVCLVAICTALASASVDLSKLNSYTFGDYIMDFDKQYLPSELNYRKALFESKLQKVRKHNSNPSHTWKESINALSDRTEEEFQALLKYRTTDSPKVSVVQGIDIDALPDSVDWRQKGVVTDVKNQGSCGSCWSFGTAETIESFWAIKTSNLIVLSEQQILDCTPNPDGCGGTGGCEGGTSELAYAQIVKMGGLSTEASYPYAGVDEPCNNSAVHPVAKITGYVDLPSNEYAPVMNAVATLGPLAIAVDASSWSDYYGGVFDGCNNVNPDIDHLVQLVGYGTDPTAGTFWLVRNSWGSDWGEDGYIRLLRHTSNNPCGIDTSPQDGLGCNGGPPNVTVCGNCGILYDVTYPTL